MAQGNSQQEPSTSNYLLLAAYHFVRFVAFTALMLFGIALITFVYGNPFSGALASSSGIGHAIVKGLYYVWWAIDKLAHLTLIAKPITLWNPATDYSLTNIGLTVLGSVLSAPFMINYFYPAAKFIIVKPIKWLYNRVRNNSPNVKNTDSGSELPRGQEPPVGQQAASASQPAPNPRVGNQAAPRRRA